MTELDAALRLKLIDEVSATAKQIADKFGIVGAEAWKSAKDASAALTEMRLKELGARTEANRLSRELRTMRASGEATEQEIRELSVKLVQAREETRRFGSEARNLARAEREMAKAASGAGSALANAARQSTAVQAASSDSATATGRSARMLNLVSKESKNTGREMGGLVNVFAELGYSIGAAIPGGQQIGTQMAMMGGSAFQLGASFGVWGTVLGVVVGLFPTLLSLLQRTDDANEDLADSNARVNQTFLERVDAIRQAREEQERLLALDRGEQSVEEQRDALAVAEQQVAKEERDLRTAQARVRRRSGTERETLEAVPGGDQREGENTFQAIFRNLTERERAAAEARGDVFNPMAGLGARMRTASSLQQDAEAVQDAERDAGSARARRDELAGALEEARTREEEERSFERSQEAPGLARQRVTDLLEVSGLSERQRHRVEQQLSRGRLDDRSRSLLGDRADEVLEAQRQVSVAEQQAAQARLGQHTFLDEVQGEATQATPESTSTRARRVMRRAAPSAPAEPEPDRLSAGALRTLERLDQTRLRIVVEDSRVRTFVESSGPAPIEVSASGPGLTGGQQ